MTSLFKVASKLFNQTKSQILILILLTLLSYGNILQNGFAWDDHDFFEYWFTIRNSENYSSLLSLPDLLAGDLPEGHRGVFRPVRSVYYLFSYKLYGENPFFYHFQAILIHALVVILIYFISLKITKNETTSFITASIFSTHPIHTEAVTYTTASMDTLGLLFFFASFYFYIEAETGRLKNKTTFLLSYLLAFLAFFTYEMTLILPLLLILYKFCFRNPDIKNFRKHLSLLPYLIILAFYFFIRFYFLKIGNRADYLGPMFIISANQAKISLPEHYLNYLRLLILPLNLTIAHTLPNNLLKLLLDTVITDPSGKLLNQISKLGSLIPILWNSLFLGISFALFRKQKLILFCFCWFFISLLPVSNIVPQGAAFAERYLYVPSFGFCLLLGFLFSQIFKIKKFSASMKIVAFCLITLLITSYSYLTFRRNIDWHNGETLMLSALKVDPKSTVAYGGLGLIKMREGKYDEAIKYLRQSLDNGFYEFSTRLQIGLAFQKKSETDLAIKEFKDAIRLSPHNYLGYSYLGNAYFEKGEINLALENYLKASEIEPKESLNTFNLGIVYTKLNNYPEAIKSYQQSLAIDPDQSQIYANLGYIYSQQKNPKSAIQFYQKSLELNQNPKVRETLNRLKEESKSY